MFRVGLILTAGLMMPLAANACSVPVFRFALEQWTPSDYDLLLFHRGPLTSDQKNAWSELQARSKSANAKLNQVDLAGEVKPELRAVWEADRHESESPRVLLRFPESGPKIASVWTGSLADAGKIPLFDSPSRQAMFDRLTFGNAGVVLLLLSGDAEKDSAAREFLRNQLPRIASKIELPARTEDGPQVQSLVPMKVAFPLIEVARSSEEETFVRILLGSEDGLATVKGPIAFPVFGRGRALCSLHGQDLQKVGELQRSLEFLCRACSCGVKELNPGLDLLIRGNWDSLFSAEAGPKPREVIPSAVIRPSAAGGPSRSESRSPPPRGYNAVEMDTESSTEPRINWRRAVILGAIVLFLLTGAWAWHSRRPSSPTTPENF